MKTREVSIKEIKALIKAYEGRDYYTQFKDFALAFYGDKSYKVVVLVQAEYNDNYYDDKIASITVYDKNGKKLKPDPKLPIVKNSIEAYHAKMEKFYNEHYKDEGEKYQRDDKQALDAELNDTIYDLEIPNGREDHNDEDFSETYTYIVGEPPKMPKILIAEE